MRKDTRLSPLLKQQKAGWGLGMRLVSVPALTRAAIASIIPPRKWSVVQPIGRHCMQLNPAPRTSPPPPPPPHTHTHTHTQTDKHTVKILMVQVSCTMALLGCMRFVPFVQFYVFPRAQSYTLASHGTTITCIIRSYFSLA